MCKYCSVRVSKGNSVILALTLQTSAALKFSVYAGFIDFIVVPTFTVLTDMTEKIVTPLIDEATHSSLAGFRRSRSGPVVPDSVGSFNSSFVSAVN